MARRGSWTSRQIAQGVGRELQRRGIQGPTPPPLDMGEPDRPASHALDCPCRDCQDYLTLAESRADYDRLIDIEDPKE